MLWYQPTLEKARCDELNGTFVTSSIGRGNARCGPGPSKTPSPSPTGLPMRRMIALFCSFTVKKPEAKNITTSSTMMIWMMKKLLRKASDSACVPGSSGVGGSAAGRPAGGCNGLDSWSLICQFDWTGYGII